MLQNVLLTLHVKYFPLFSPQHLKDILSVISLEMACVTMRRSVKYIMISDGRYMVI